jgi:uncharacterized protein (TIGR02246 family)
MMIDDLMQETPTRDEQAVRALVRQVQDGWNAGDGAAFAAPFADDANYVAPHGQPTHGRATIAHGHQAIFDTMYKNSTNTFTVEAVRFLRPDVAVVHVHHHLRLAEPVPWFTGETVRGTQARSTWVVTRDGGTWRVAALHNSAIAGTQEWGDRSVPDPSLPLPA